MTEPANQCVYCGCLGGKHNEVCIAAENVRLRALVRKALYAWQGTGPPLVLDELRKALGIPVETSSITDDAWAGYNRER